ncbi:MAG: response regulator transcription factor [Clostridiaceae bacterium]|nr:response regulator transcription factor [Clostridiaceae bacterium]
MRRIVIIEDDIMLRNALIETFSQRGYEVIAPDTFVAVEKQISEYRPDLLILDIGLPGTSGFDLCRRIRPTSTFPILILTARDTLNDELRALELGAEDYLSKPCPPERLIARADRLMRTYENARHVIRAGTLQLDLDSYKLSYKDKNQVLSDTEGRILRELIEAYPNTVSKTEIMRSLWGGSDYVDENVLQVNMTRLRKALSAIGLEDRIETVRGVGYRLPEGDH